jgi:hypothetical protein
VRRRLAPRVQAYDYKVDSEHVTEQRPNLEHNTAFYSAYPTILGLFERMDTTTTATAVNRSHENTSTLNTSTAFRADLNVSLRYRHDALSSHEKWWMERYDFLESRGYRLRPRYRPGWEPSWRTNGMRLHKCEDRIRILVSKHSHDVHSTNLSTIDSRRS